MRKTAIPCVIFLQRKVPSHSNSKAREERAASRAEVDEERRSTLHRKRGAALLLFVLSARMRKPVNRNAIRREIHDFAGRHIKAATPAFLLGASLFFFFSSTKASERA